ncbi:MAG: membrane protease YdiL (CAAX protease family) [Phycisphaerales bacterium]|jgi:membrane protease YdiL (CAAX protease family)
MQPLTVLVFLLPFVLLYELGSVFYLADEAGRIGETVAAYRIMAKFFEFFGAFGLYLPGLALVTVLLIQHAISNDRWRVRPSVLGLMGAESVVLTTPLLLMALVFGSPAAAQAGEALSAWPVQARLTIAVGAGLYEELLFRMVLIAMVHTLAVDLAGLGQKLGSITAVLVSAAAFAFYHDLSGGDGSTDVRLLLFLFLAGIYFGTLYLARGFGIVVAVHMLYDTVVLVLIQPHGTG